MRFVILALVLPSCGRIGYDAQVIDAHAIDGAAPDIVEPTCPAGTAPIAEDARTCIELVERGTQPWTVAKQECEALGRRLCADLEWFAGCENVTSIVDMIDGGWEWVAEETAGVALKRGADECMAMSSHVVTDPYEFRCCLDL